MKKVAIVVLSFLLIFSLTACKNEEAVNGETPVAGESGAITKEYTDMGIKFEFGNVWQSSFDNDNVDGSSIGDPEDPENPVYGGIAYDFASDEVVAEYYDIVDNETDSEKKNERLNAVFAQLKPVFSIVVFRADKLPSDSELKEYTNAPHNEKIAEHDDLVFFFSYDDYNDADLSEGGKKAFKELYDELQNVKATVKTFKPITTQEAVAGLGKVEFNLDDLHGDKVDSKEFFKENKLTMINIWATFCGPCINEMPDLQELYKEISADNMSLIGIVGDVDDEDGIELANKIIDTKGAEFVSVIANQETKDTLIANIAGYPTSIFVDSEGNIVGEVVTGSRSKDEYKEIIMRTLELVK